MPLFRYKAVAPGGAGIDGRALRANEAEILDRLRDQAWMPMQVAPVTGRPVGRLRRLRASALRRGAESVTRVRRTS